MSNLVNVPGAKGDPGIANFVAASGTMAQILVEVSPAQPSAAIPLIGGCRVIDMTAASSNANANNMVIYDAVQATVVGATGVGSAIVSGANTITFGTAGAPYLGGWKVGDQGVIFAARGTAPDFGQGFIFTVTSVTTNTIVATGLTNGTLVAGSRIVRLAQDFTASIPANAGNSTSVPNVPLLNNANDFSADRIGSDLGANGMIVVAMQAAISGAGVVSARARPTLF